MKDFTYKSHKTLLESFKAKDYSFITFSEYLTREHPKKFITLRHDVEQHYKSALKFAQTQYQFGIKGTYFFRILPKCFKPEIVKQIAELGHEVGYHYDDLTECKGDYTKAIARFEKNLQTLRDIAPVQTICMDGSPLSKYDNKDIWKKHDYKRLGLIGEPYYDIDFDKVFYLTDTGRKWDGWKTSVRDKVPQQDQWEKEGLVFHSTQDIINALESGLSTSSRTMDTKPVEVPNQIMFTFHPQRWTEGGLPWLKELILQNVKNFIKGFLVK